MKQFRLPITKMLKANIDAILHKRHMSRKDLAFACRKSESWISKIYREERRSFSIHDIDQIADALGLSPFQLFQPGIAGTVERRSGEDRRKRAERRVGHQNRLIANLQVELNRVPRFSSAALSKGAQHEPRSLPAPLLAIVADYEQRIADYLAAHPDVAGGQAATPSRRVAGASRHPRGVGRSNPAPTK